MHRIGIVVALATLALTPAATAREYVLDLADVGQTFLVEAGAEISLKVAHRLPGAAYHYEVRRTGILPPLEDFRETVEDLAALDESCKRLLARIRKAGEGTSERTLRAELVAAKAASPDAGCLARIQRYEAGTSTVLADEVTLGEGQTLTIAVTRVEPAHTEWTFELRTGQERRWLLHYGFSFLPDEDDEFFTRAMETEDGSDAFVITPSAERSGAEFEPTVTFTYLPRGSDDRPLVPKFTAGLGADVEERLVFAGLSWVIGDNVNLFVGAAGHEQTHLKGMYEEGQLVQEMLSGDQLVDETFELNAIVGVGFRFGSNPFKKEPAVSPAGGGGGSATETRDAQEATGSPGSEGSEGAAGSEELEEAEDTEDGGAANDEGRTPSGAEEGR